MTKDQLLQIQKRLEDVNSIISTLDPAIKEASFKLLIPFITEGVVTSSKSEGKNVEDAAPTTARTGDVRDFFASFDPQKPSDSARVLTGWFYTQRGSSAFTLDELNGLFDEVGVPKPNRLNMTLRSASHDGKKLFKQAGHSQYRPTVYGENYFKSEMNLKPGKRIE